MPPSPAVESLLESHEVSATAIAIDAAESTKGSRRILPSTYSHQGRCRRGALQLGLGKANLSNSSGFGQILLGKTL